MLISSSKMTKRRRWVTAHSNVERFQQRSTIDRRSVRSKDKRARQRTCYAIEFETRGWFFARRNGHGNGDCWFAHRGTAGAPKCTDGQAQFLRHAKADRVRK